jgi:hypothetical protein
MNAKLDVKTCIVLRYANVLDNVVYLNLITLICLLKFIGYVFMHGRPVRVKYDT